jgi:RNA polymerase sigma-70 factor, ECF subfamily
VFLAYFVVSKVCRISVFGFPSAFGIRNSRPPCPRKGHPSHPQNGLGFFIQNSFFRCLCIETLVVNGDPNSAWCERLYRAKAAELVLYGRALGLSHSEAEDVLQETFVMLLRRAEPPENPDHFCVRSFRNRALNLRRGLWRRLARELEARRWFERNSREHPAEGEAMRALAMLPRDQREAIVLKIWHGYTFEEIGQVTDISPNTAAGRYRYGLEKLRRFLEKLGYEQDTELGETVVWLASAPPVTPD